MESRSVKADGRGSARTAWSRVHAWLESLRVGSRFKPDDDGSPGILATTQGLSLFAAAGALDAESRASGIAYLQSCQKTSGVFVDPSASSTEENAAWHTSWRVLQTLDALGAQAKLPPAVEGPWSDGDWFDWLNSHDDLGLATQSEVVACLLYSQLHAFETNRDAEAAARYYRILKWLEARKNPDSGLWGGDADDVVASYRFLQFYRYVRQPTLRAARAADTVLAYADAAGSLVGHFAGGAHADASAVGLLALSHQLYNYRRDDIERALEATGRALVEARNTTLEDAALRLQALAIIDERLGDDPSWHHTPRPGPHFHTRGATVSDHERTVLPKWLAATDALRWAATAPRADGPPVLSVILPCYNLGLYVVDSIDSLAQQTLQDFDVVLVDDGSTDAYTQWLVQRLHYPDGRVRVVTQQNQGVGAARNRGIRTTRSCYICCLDPDDRLRPDFFRQARAVLESRPEVGFVSGQAQMFDERDDLYAAASCEPSDMLVLNPVMQPALYRRDAWEAVGGYFNGFSRPGLEDWDFWLHMMERGYRGHMLQEVMWDYRARPDQMSHAMMSAEHWPVIMRELVQRHPQTFHAYLGEFTARSRQLEATALGWARDREQKRHWWETKAKIWRQQVASYEQLYRKLQAWSQKLDSDRRYWQSRAEAQPDVHRGPSLDEDLPPALQEEVRKALASNATANPDEPAQPTMVDEDAPDYANTPASETRARFHYAIETQPETPAVTIVTPFFNTGEVFHQTAHSVRQQSFQQWEWLIINDDSSDGEAMATLEYYRHGDSRIRVIDHASNRGPSAARNTGFREARAPYVVQLDSDNLLEPTAIEKWFWYLKTHPHCAFVKGYTVGFGAEQYLWSRGFHEGKAFLEANLCDATCMVRVEAHRDAGGYDESIRAGFEDWDFWLRCADVGLWGNTLPEYLDWYRRRPRHDDRWADWDGGRRQSAFAGTLRRRYPKLWNGRFPAVPEGPTLAPIPVSDTLPATNRLTKKGPRLLMLVPWLTCGGADKFNLDLAKQLVARGWEITIAGTRQGDNAWAQRFSQVTPDIFILSRFLPLADHPRFLRYLIASRDVDVVLITHSELGYELLPYLRARAPDVTYVDYNHIVENQWKNGGYPRMALLYQSLLDLSVVSSEHLRQWMLERGAKSERVRVCTTNVDTKLWQPDPGARALVRAELGLSEKEPVILFAGRICPQKQPEVLAGACIELDRRGQLCTVLVAGDGPGAPTLQRSLAEHRLLDRVRLLAVVPNRRVRQLMAAADIFFLPSESEGISLAIFEAMACGLAVVGADVGGQRELVTPDVGYLVQRSNETQEAREYAEHLAVLIEDRERTSALGQAARDRVVAHFDLDTMGDRMLEHVVRAACLRRVFPRPRPSSELALAQATQAAEAARLARLADVLWAERAERQQDLQRRHPMTQLWHTFPHAFPQALRTKLEPALNGLAALAGRARRALLQPGSQQRPGGAR